MKDIKYAAFSHKSPLSSTACFSLKEAYKARSFHNTLEEYSATPLAELADLISRTHSGFKK